MTFDGRVVLHTPHPAPHTLHPTPYTLHPSPCTLHHAPYTLHLATHTLHLKTETPNPKPTPDLQTLRQVKSNKYAPNSGSNWVDERVSLECASGYVFGYG